MKYKLSIIVPIYNVEEYICRCAESLLKQTVPDNLFEVVFVNDGTKDNSIKVLKEYVDFEKVPNFKLIHKENGGLSSARNYGIEHTTGEYIWFVDSDDWIEPNSVEKILDLAVSTPDIVFTSQMFKNVGEVQSLKYKESLNTVGKGVEILKKVPPSCAVAYICKRGFLDAYNFRFKEGIYFEDSELTPKLLYMAERVVATDVPLYHHFMREGSITHNATERCVRDYKTVLESHLQFYRDNVEERYKSHYSNDITPKIITFLDYSMAVYGKTNKEIDCFIKDNKEIGEMLTLCTHKPTHYYGLLLKLFPSSATLIYYLINIVKGRKSKLRLF